MGNAYVNEKKRALDLTIDVLLALCMFSPTTKTTDDAFRYVFWRRGVETRRLATIRALIVKGPIFCYGKSTRKGHVKFWIFVVWEQFQDFYGDNFQLREGKKEIWFDTFFPFYEKWLDVK